MRARSRWSPDRPRAGDHDDEDVADRDEAGGQREHQGAVDDHVDLDEPVPQHRDRDTQRHCDLGQVQRQRGQPGSLLTVHQRDHEDDHHTEREEGRRGCDPQQLATQVVLCRPEAPRDGDGGGDQAGGDESDADREQRPGDAAVAGPLAVDEVPGVEGEGPSSCRMRPDDRDPDAQRHRGDARRPSGARRKTKIKAVKAGQPSRGEAQAATCPQYGEPGPSPSSTQTLYASPASVTESRLATDSSQPSGCLGWRETIRAPMSAQPRLASGASGQPWSAQVASLSSGR